jgi:hypothetical protein
MNNSPSSRSSIQAAGFRPEEKFHTEIAKITKRMMSYSPSSRSSIQAAGFHTEENSNTEIAKITKTDHEYRRVDRSFSQGPANCSIGVPSLCDLCDLCVKNLLLLDAPSESIVPLAKRPANR